MAAALTCRAVGHVGSLRRTGVGDVVKAAASCVPLMDLPAFMTAHLPPAPVRVLEVGCGDGRLARALADGGHRVTAIDPGAPEGAIFRQVWLEEFEDEEPFDAAVASRSLHHIADLGGALSKLRSLLVSGGRLIVFEHAWERFDAPTARWYLGKRRAAHPHAAESVGRTLAEWKADHADLHTSTVLLRELDLRFIERFIAWTPYLYGELGAELEQEERELIEAGEIQATGFVYVGETRSG
jgi:SAM-dependent methyltransferase